MQKAYLGGVMGTLFGIAGAVTIYLIFHFGFLPLFLIGVVLGAIGFWIGFYTNQPRRLK
jgi:uncharacterized membrane protein